MRKLLIPLLAAFAFPTVINAEELIELKPINPHSYLKSSLTKWESNDKRYISFEGTTELFDCWGNLGHEIFKTAETKCERNPEGLFRRIKKTSLINKDGWKIVLFKYEVDCIERTYNRIGDVQNWHGLIVDQTPFLVSQKYCPFEEWSKLPNKVIVDKKSITPNLKDM